MNSIHSYSFKGKRALIRVDFNVPLNKTTLGVTDDTRIKAAMPTIRKVLDGGGSVVLMSHLGRPKGSVEPKFSMRNCITTIEKHLGFSIQFAEDCMGKDAQQKAANLQPGQVLLLENLRLYSQEEKGDLAFAEALSKYGDCYVNDAFGTAHRAHASTTIIARFFPQDKMFGYLIEKEIESVDKVLNSSQKPLTAIVGGAKVSSKITIITKLLDKVDNLIIGGGMAYTFIKAQGGKVGKSLVEDDHIQTALDILKAAKEKNVAVLLPTDTIYADEFSESANTGKGNIFEIPEGWMGLDIAEESINSFKKAILSSKLILWNGPMGVFEMQKFQAGTVEVAKAVAEATKNGAFSLVGGGDSVAAVNAFGLENEVSHVSTGGGAMLEYLEGIQLPGIAAILEK